MRNEYLIALVISYAAVAFISLNPLWFLALWEPEREAERLFTVTIGAMVLAAAYIMRRENRGDD